MRIIRILTGFIFLILLFNQCSNSWKNRIQLGKVMPAKIDETIDVSVEAGIIIVPTEIDGKLYRFLFDTGAMLMISPEIQDLHNYKKISSGRITDSNNNSQIMKYVLVDDLRLGSVEFKKVSAVVADMDKNPVLNCLGVDGIIGSNLMRNCNWRIDIKNESIRMFKDLKSISLDSFSSVEFKTDRQYNLLIDINFEKAKVSNMKVDYGSNGSLSLPQHLFDKIKESDILERLYVNNGMVRSGLLGQMTPIESEVAYLDSIYGAGFVQYKSAIKSAKKALLGTDVLKDFVVDINWEDQRLYFKAHEEKPHGDTLGFGFSPGLDENDEFYVQSVLSPSKAYERGIRPGMKIIEINGVLVNEEWSICEFINSGFGLGDSMHLSIIDSLGEVKSYTLEKQNFTLNE